MRLHPSALFLVVALLTGSQTACTDSSAEGAVRIPGADAPLQTRVRVRTTSVRRETLAGAERVTGTVRAFHSANVTAEASGRVVRRRAERGDRAEAGALLVELDDSRPTLELRRAEATLRARLHDLQHARREHARGEKLVEQLAISEQQRDDLRHGLDRARDEHELALVARDTAERNLADTRITAPFAGTVDAVHVGVGDFVSVGTPVATLLDLSRMRIFAGVTAVEAARLVPGAQASASFAALGGLTLDAELRAVGRAAHERDGTYEVELWVENAEGRLRDGMVAALELAGSPDELHALAPRTALLRRAGRSEVFVVDGRGEDAVARARAVRTGRSSGDWVEILDGLEEGDEVVVDGHFALQDGTAVTLDGARTPLSN